MNDRQQSPIFRQRPREQDTDSWLMSYADMITLLLCFFIIFVSVSEPKKERLLALTDGMAGKFGSLEMETPFLGVYRALQGVVEQRQAFQDIAIEQSDRGVAVELSSSRFFSGQTAELDTQNLPVLSELVAAIKTVDLKQYRLLVEGHTDDAPVNEGAFASNWELSSARAARLVRYLSEQGVPPERLRAIGLAGTEPKVPNKDIKGEPIEKNRERNRRVTIRLEKLS